MERFNAWLERFKRNEKLIYLVSIGIVIIKIVAGLSGTAYLVWNYYLDLVSDHYFYVQFVLDTFGIVNSFILFFTVRYLKQMIDRVRDKRHSKEISLML